MEQYVWVIGGLALLLGGLLGYFARQIIANQQILRTRREAERLLDEATAKYDELLLAAREEATKVSNAAEAESLPRSTRKERV